MRHSYPKHLRLRKRSQFQRLAHQAQRLMGSWIIIEYFSNHTSVTRLGITVTKRFGKAHDRNRFKRIVREAFRLSQHDLPQGLDLIIKPRSKSKEASTSDILKDLKTQFP